MSAIKVKNAQARELAYSRYGTSVGNYRVVHNEQVDTGRWTSIHLLIIESLSGVGFWGAHYERGLTENQDYAPFEDEGDEITFANYRPVAVTTVTWERSFKAEELKTDG